MSTTLDRGVMYQITVGGEYRQIDRKELQALKRVIIKETKKRPRRVNLRGWLNKVTTGDLIKL